MEEVNIPVPSPRPVSADATGAIEEVNAPTDAPSCRLGAPSGARVSVGWAILRCAVI
jgi:hypothetical protein